ncbi:MAG: hypothetical protein ABGY75_04980, partial [Gemmataceae bacterium]
MSNSFLAYSDDPTRYWAALITTVEDAGQVGQEQLAELRQISDTLTVVLGEMDAIRRTQAQGVALQQQTLAVQQAMLAREVFQDRLEEFTYQFEKLVGQFQQPNAEFPPSTQYFLLDGVFKQIAAAGISTAVIKGRDNKAAFDACVTKGRTLFRQLSGHPDVKEALAWAEGEKKRQAIVDDKARREREAEAKRREADRQAEIARLEKRVEELEEALAGETFEEFVAKLPWLKRKMAGTPPGRVVFYAEYKLVCKAKQSMSKGSKEEREL